MRGEIEAAVQAIDAALREYARQAATGLKAVDGRDYEERFTAIRAGLDALQARENLVLNQLSSFEATTMANVAAFGESLRNIGERLLNHPIGYVYGLAFPKETKSAATASGGVDPPLMRYSAKLGLAATLGYVVGVASHRSELGVIVWTTMIAGLRTYGATLRKMILRIVGAAIGGLLVLACIIVVSPNFESLASYLLAFFVVLFLAAYVGLSSGRLAYAGQQAGVSFVVGYYTLSPSADFYTPLWRVWEHLPWTCHRDVGVLAPRARVRGKALAPRVVRILHVALELLGRAASLTEQRVQELDMQVTFHLSDVLAIADEARVEGRRSGVNPDRVIEAAGTLRRIVGRLSVIAIGRLSMPQLAVPAEMQTARIALETGLRDHLQSWLGVVEQEPGLDPRRIAEVAERFTPNGLALLLERLDQRLSASADELGAWPVEARSILLAEIESLSAARGTDDRVGSRIRGDPGGGTLKACHAAHVIAFPRGTGRRRRTRDFDPSQLTS